MTTGTHRYAQLTAQPHGLHVVRLNFGKPTAHAGTVVKSAVYTYTARRAYGSGAVKVFSGRPGAFCVNEVELLHKALAWACGGYDTLVGDVAKVNQM